VITNIINGHPNSRVDELGANRNLPQVLRKN
jgi:hypothetical protein